MSMTPLDLAGLQRWMQAVVVHPCCAEHGASSDEAACELAPERVSEVVLPSASLEVLERVGLYQGMYLIRMGEALEFDYPTLRKYLGEERFAELVKAYVAVHPSRSYTLNRLGDALPEFIKSWSTTDDAGFLHDLARLELAVSDVFDAPESDVLSPEDVAMIPQDAWAGARLVPTAALRVLSFTHPVTESFAAAKKGQPIQRVRRRAAWTTLFRKNYIVMRVDLTRPEHDLLAALVSGVPLGEALEQATSSLKASERPDRVFGWFRSWIVQGLFSRVELA